MVVKFGSFGIFYGFEVRGAVGSNMLADESPNNEYPLVPILYLSRHHYPLLLHPVLLLLPDQKETEKISLHGWLARTTLRRSLFLGTHCLLVQRRRRRKKEEVRVRLTVTNVSGTLCSQLLAKLGCYYGNA